MSPFFFGTSRRRLFGVYHPAQTSRATAKAVVLCYPWGHEYINAHRSMVKLAGVLAEGGYHVLRFDYFGTGDSGGEAVDVTLKGCREDILTAAEELLDMSGGESVSLVGLRLGAALAAEVAVAERGLVDRLVLWDPVISGPDHVEAMFRAAANMPNGMGPPPLRAPEKGGGHEICGFPLTDTQRDQIAGVDLIRLVPKLPRKSVTLVTQPAPAHERYLEAVGDAGAQGERFLRITDRAAWHEDWPRNAGMMPVDVINRIGAWMA
ncbi:alpha/beta fold hydrolase [Allosediminivita pacifica]|uniref:Serine aminopeptidase S33 family n=1 Tax=Allosediminivita pacifica TaxID=1267769 RepID=A0A2T6B7E8_9RHOB|nr:alpha/beta fold hydrolase [Allosediminivita pacifica]PTX51973.1 serine aminopeptidase S33 family [Allosediminivita pacifica]GGA98218.1 hypothetical protein GCM10011324_05590 [Allosediminivita pacifica]